MKIDELEELKTKIQKNHEAVIALIDRLLQKARKEVKGTAVIAPITQRKESMSKSVERIVKNFTGDFEIYDIFSKYEEAIGPASGSGFHVRREIGNVINKLKQRNPAEIEVVQPGKGSRSGIYRIKLAQ